MRTNTVYWIIGDTHFYHDKIHDFVYRPVNYMDKVLNNWKNIVLSQDIVIHLGDVIFYRYNELKSILDDLPGRKILARGNHDKKTNTWFMQNGFDFSGETFSIGDTIFSHEKLDYNKKYKQNIHGHTHIPEIPLPLVYMGLSLGNPDGYYNYTTDFHRLYSLELEQYMPVSLTKFIAHSSRSEYYTNKKHRYMESYKGLWQEKKK